MPNNSLLIRADASTEIGVGHVMRCLALGQAWLDLQGDVTFLAASIPNGLASRIVDEGMHLQTLELDGSPAGSTADAASTGAVLRQSQPAFLVLDGYAFTDAYEGEIRSHADLAGTRVLAFDDDAHANHHNADLILNQNLGADATLYGNRDGLLVSSKFTLLRTEFTDALSRTETHSSSPNSDRTHEPTNLLVTFGGSDPDNVTGRVLDYLSEVNDPSLRIRALLGAANPHFESLESFAEKSDRVTLLRDTRDMVAMYQWADLAISAGGSTNWELCYFGIPRCSVILADNQRPIIEALHAANCTINLGWHNELSNDRVVGAVTKLLTDGQYYSQMREANLRCVDGRGAKRVVKAMVACLPTEHER